MKCGICGKQSKDTIRKLRNGPKGYRTYDVCPKCDDPKRSIKVGSK